ncbi:PREDICTED: piezo-type mechanosensitive ion channel component 1 [Nipponia nippon]|uniref:piezo-type mechanosensitive ion channel component 1 n=1 Tax=Nipponia nippon TaxID=128390 RepID=UPI000510943A|nr:PREDICTED: piezo-type mechanosensitive ion channel component 1 [Nipponia nippon]
MAWAAVSGWRRLLRHIWGPGLGGGKSPESAGEKRAEPAEVGVPSSGIPGAGGCSPEPACLFRFNVLSLVYLLFLLLLPWFPGPTPCSAGGHTGRLLKALLGTSILFLLAHFVFQICLYTLPILDQLLGPSCSTWEVLARHIGVTRLDLSDIPNSVRLVAPDVGILLVSSLCLCLCRRLVPKAGAAARGRRPESLEPLERGEEEDVERHGGTAAGDTPLSTRLRVTAHWLLWAAGKGLAILLLALAGITLPSASSSIYYLLFVGLCTWWACHLPASRLAFDILCVLVGIYAGGHLLCLYAYQAPFVQGVFPPPTIWARVFGFKDIVLYRNCSRPNALVLNTGHPWPVYANPGILLLLYYTMATLVKLRRLDARRTAAPARPPVRCPEREVVELESWPKDTDGMAEDTKPMLSPSTGKPGSGTENCTVHVMGNLPQPGRRRPAERLPLHTLGHVIMNQSYVCALIAMMVWSITYHSWLTFVLLLWACLIWTVRSRHHFAMLCSPFLLLYGIALCSLQYVWGMDLAPELPTRVGFMSLEQLGLVHPKYPCLDLGAKLLLTLTFWLLLRQFVKEKLLTRRCPATPLLEVTVSDTEPSRQRDVLKALGVLVRDFYAKYWICVCAGMFIVVSFAGRLVVYKIVYMFLFLLCLTLFQVYYSLWRKVLKGFWWLVVAYTMLVLIAVYTFQFEDFPMYWKNLTGLTDEQLGDLGLEQFSVSELFSSTLIPGFFLLACILQLHYFHRPFMHITDLEHVPAATPAPCHIPRPEELHGSRLLRDAAAAESAGMGNSDTASQVPTKWGLVLERLIVLGWTFSNTLTRGQVFVGRLLELHVLKLVALYTVWVALQEVSLMNFLLVLLWAFAMPYCRFRHMASCLSTVWTCIIIVCKMLYQLKIVDPSEYSSNCTQPQLNGTNLNPEELGNSTLYRGPVDPANWFGIRKGYPNLGYIQNHLLVLLLLVFEAVVYRRQEYYRKQHQLVAPVTETIFEDVSREHLDHGLGSCAKYFLNYFYYKFGLEICFLMTVNVIGQRMNFMVILHGCWLVFILTRRRRAAIARLWPKYCLFLVIFLLYQYLLCVGMPPALCVDYPWRWSRAFPINSALIKWLYLPDFFVAPKSTNLINDFVLLLCAAQQWRGGEAERTEEWLRAAGENTDRLDLVRDPRNPTPNFIHCRSYLDMAKVVVFRYLFWFVLVVVFITGATRISLFGLGYLLACFYLLLFGTAMLRKPARARLVLWDCLILYNITVIISKNMLSLLSCVFVQQMQSNFCWVIQLFSLVCTVKGYYDPKEMGKDQDCSLPVEEAGIIWDSICFFFLLLQRRVFLSYYFLHVMLDLQASALQASRGVALFKASILKSIRSHRQAEKKSLAQLKRQMERIRAKQEKYHQERLPGGTGEGQDEGRPGESRGGDSPGGPADPSRQRERWWRPWLDHAAVLHSGEYFLFESDSEEEEEAVVPEEPRPGRQSAFQLAYQAWVTNTRTVLRQGGQEQPEPPGAEVAAGDSRGREEELQAPEEAEGPSRREVTPPALALAERSNVVQRALNTLRFLWVLCRAMVDGLTQWLDACTREHADMSTVLRLERYVLTRRLATGEDMHRGVLDELYLPPPEEPPEELSPRGARGADPQNGVASRQVHRYPPRGQLAAPQAGAGGQGAHPCPRAVPSGHQGAAPTPAGCPLPTGRPKSRRLYFPELEESEQFYQSHNRFLKLLLAGYRCVAAHSELLCYFIIILNNMVTASVISLFLPILVFLWAMLSIPRPSKRFWMTAIIFTEVMVVVKYLFQFGFFPWNGYAMLVRNEGKPFFPPRILGLEKTDRYIKYDLIQLLALFFHRSLLLSYGLWDHEEDPFPKKKAEAERAEDEEEEEKREEAASLPLAVGEEGTEALAEPGAPGAAAGPEPEPEGDAVGQEEGAGATQLRFRRKRRRGKKQLEAAPEQEEEEEEAKQSHAQKKLKAFGLRVKLFFLTMAQNMYQPVRRFFWDILHTQHRAATDVYAFMFLADVVDFIIIIFGFWAFGKHSAAADITSSLSDDQVPEAFLVMLLIQFTTMVIDRALYLRKTVLGKLIFQVILVFGIHLWMFFILPAVTERLFSLNTVAQLWYFVKCIYFSLSAYQIRCGYPTRILGNFLTKKYNHLNLFLFQGFRLVPFLVELRAVMDWVWTDTTLSLSNWMCVEDIYANIFIIKCSRETEKKYPQPKGQKKKKIVKYGMGGLIILFLVAIIWFPLLFMSLVRSVVGVVNHPIDVTVTLKLGGYEPLFTMSAQQQSIQPFTPQDYEALTKQFERQPVAMQFITLYGYEDIVTARIEGSSGSLWSISPPSREQMRRELQNGSSDITLRLTWTFQRDLGKGGTVEHTFDKHTTDLQPGAPQRMELAQLLQGTRDTPVQVPKLFPKYIRAPNGPEANPVKQLLPDGEDSYLDVEVQLKRERASAGRGGDSFLEWWVVRLKEAPPRDGNILPMVIFNDKVSPPSLGFLAGYGIMGLYVSIVLVIGKFVRGFFSEISHSIMFEELPCVDRILKLCQDIFLVRETGELELEEELYAKLIFLYRSPETMIKWTREKE